MRYVAVVALAVVIQAGAQGQPRADVVLLNGRILTVDRNDTVADAVAITAGKIAAVGTTAQIRALAGDGTEVIDLRGRAVTPADRFTRAFSGRCAVHGGPWRRGGDVDRRSKRRVAAQVATLKPGEWVRGRVWDEGNYKDAVTSPGRSRCGCAEQSSVAHAHHRHTASATATR